ncbi:MAG: exonuclease domain-containing protein [Parahaliea sp.]
MRWRRFRYRRQVAGSALATCWDAAGPKRRQFWPQVEYLACDAEMSSLNVDEGELLSLGWVPVIGGSIRLGEAQHHLIAAQTGVGQSAGIHQLRDCDLENAEAESVVLTHFCRAAAGRLLVFHHAPLDLAYLNRACQRHFGAPLLLPCLDTMMIEKRRRDRTDTVVAHGSLTLTACRRRYSLPAYPVHNALVDALATAELFQAQAAYSGAITRSGRHKPARLGDLL